MASDSVSKTVAVNAPVSKVYGFVSNLGNWPKWAKSTIVTVKPGSSDWWALETRTGLGRMRVRSSDETAGTVDVEMVASGAQWPITARVVAKGDGTECTMSFIQPPSVSKEAFEKQVGSFEQDFTKLKALLES